ncbi:hypothetical protein VTK56DRAFT_3042 [Thermocarpiscus australiensis]
MPQLSEVSYSHEATIAAVSGYFDFLAKMYLNESDILRPPEGGWPEITPDRLKGLGKTDEVVLLLRHLPYLRDLSDGSAVEDSTPARAGGMNTMTEPYPYSERGLVPPHVVGLISTKDDLFMLDTQLGVIYWLECPGTIRHNPPTREPILDDAYDYAPSECEAEWRGNPAWAVADFFELLKNHFRRLRTVPVSPVTVYDLDNLRPHRKVAAAMPLVQSIYRDHGWPGLDRYRKEECLQAVQAMLKERCGEDYWLLGR